MFAAHLCLGSLPFGDPPLLACLSSSSQDVVELRRFHLAGAEEVGRLNYIFIGNPGTGKVRGQPLLYPCHLSMHDTASHLHALPHTTVLQTSIAYVWARLLGQMRMNITPSQMRLPQPAPRLPSQTTNARETLSL